MHRFFAVLLALTVLGCVHVRQISTDELAQLDGFDSSGVSLASDDPTSRYVTLQDVDGEAVAFTRDSRLRLLLEDGRSVEEQFRVITVRDGALSGTTKQGNAVLVPLRDVRSADVSWLNEGVTVVTLVTGGLVSLAALVALGVFFSLISRGVPGRPLRIRGKSTVAATCDNAEWVARDSRPNVDALSPKARAELAGAWLADAQAEHASVAAFSRLSSMLLAVGAPPELIAAAHRAALDEVDHARRTFALASAYAGRALGPAPLPELLTAPLVSQDGVTQLAVESLVDGCLNEGVAAALAAAAARSATDSAVRATLEVIAKDEATHRDLAWDIVAWCARVSDGARGAVASTLERLPMQARFDDCSAELEGHGRLSAARQREIFSRVQAEVVARAQQLLGATEAA